LQVIVKSISKSFGVPGLRLGVLASNDLEMVHFLKKDVAIWNINSFAEFYLQIMEKYKGDYLTALKKFIAVRKMYYQELQKVCSLSVIPTQANYFLCEVLPPYRARDLAERLLNEHSILIKDLSLKKGFNNGEYIRLSVKTEEENNKLIRALKMILGG